MNYTQNFNFWIGSSRHFESALLIGTDIKSENHEGLIEIYDPDGELVNELNLELTKGALSIMEVDQFLGACKNESGFKHARAQIECSEGVQASCRLQGRENAVFMRNLYHLSERRALFMPCPISDRTENYLVISNFLEELQEARCRLFWGKRTPDVSIFVPPRGTRIIRIEEEFRVFIEQERDEGGIGYLRLTTMGKTGFGAQFLTLTHGEKGSELIMTVS